MSAASTVGRPDQAPRRWRCASLLCLLNELGWNLLEETRRRVVVGSSEQHPAPGRGQVEPILGSGHAHIGQAALLFHLVGVTQRSHVGKDPILHPRQEDGRILESLGVVEGHQRDGPRPFLQLVGFVLQGTRSRGRAPADRGWEGRPTPTPLITAPSLRISNSSATEASSRRFSIRPRASMVLSDSSARGSPVSWITASIAAARPPVSAFIVIMSSRPANSRIWPLRPRGELAQSRLPGAAPLRSRCGGPGRSDRDGRCWCRRSPAWAR